VACWNAGDLDCVEEAYGKALAARRRLGDPLLIGRTLNGMGSLHFRRGDYDSALVYYEDARRIRETLDRPVDLAVTLTFLGHVQYRRGRLNEARSRYQAALDLLGPEGPGGPISEARNGLANVLSTLGGHGEAIRIYQEEIAALGAGDAQVAVLRLNLGRGADLRAARRAPGSGGGGIP
jgi:tetratricopeptide (TPR) repeat protein